MKLYSYNNGSASAKALAAALGIKMLKHEGKELNLKGKEIINWGCSTPLEKWRDMNHIGQIYNRPEAVARAVNKLTAFQHLEREGLNIPSFSDDQDWAFNVTARGIPVVCRTKLNGHSGEGIVIANDAREVVQAPLYTEYIKKQEEYRLHVMHNEVFFVQRKARKMEVPNEEVNWQVRNLAGGFIYANQNVEVALEAQDQAIAAINALGLDFGAVDIIWNGREDKYYVLEVNTACGLAGTTLEKYVEQFKRYQEV